MEIFILGLEHEFRGSLLLEYFKSESIHPTVVFGIDGRVSSNEVNRYKASERRMNLLMGRLMTSAEVAVALSHRLIYQKFLETSSEWALVLEDDSYPTESFDLSIFDLVDVSEPLIVNLSGVENLVHNYDVFPCLILRPQNLSSSENKLIVYHTLGNTFGCWAYLINRKAAEIAVQNFDLIDSTVDWPYLWRSKVRFARPEKTYFSVNLEGSLVDEGRSRELESGISALPSWSESRFLQRLKTLFGLLGVVSLIARIRGEGFRQHYLEKVFIPFMIRRINTIE